MQELVRESTGISLGTWPEWIAAIFTSLAFLVAAVTYMRAAKANRESQARLVYASFTKISEHGPGEQLELLGEGVDIGGGEGYTIVPPVNHPVDKATMLTVAPIIRATVRIHNGSKELIGPFKLMIVNSGTGKLFDRVSMVYGPIEPESDKLIDFSVINEVWPNSPSISPTIWFRDSSGRWWRRHQYEPVEAIHDDPNNTADTAAERAQRDRNVLLMGGTGLPPEPKPPLRVMWHRFWRRMRGKSPIP